MATLIFPVNFLGGLLSSLSLKQVTFPKATLKCLSIGTPKAINFPFVSNKKLMFFRCPSIQ